MKLLTTDDGRKFLHFELFDETAEYPRGSFVTVDGDWYRLAEHEKDPNSGWLIPLEVAEQPEGIGPLHNLFSGDAE